MLKNNKIQLVPSDNDSLQLINWDQRVNKIKNAAFDGDEQAQFELGAMYEIGAELEQNEEDALKWFEKSALQGHSEACWRLGRLLQKGSTLIQNDASAFYWYQLAAMDGHTDSQYEAARYHESGSIAPQNQFEAEYLYTKAAEAGHIDAMVALADLKLRIVGPNRVSGNWYKTAARAGRAEAC